MKIVDPFRMGNWKRCQTHSFFASKVGGVVTRFEVTVVILFVSPVTYVFFPPVAGLSLRDLSHLKDPCVSPVVRGSRLHPLPSRQAEEMVLHLRWK
jgi:hypothetical protein